MPERVKASGKNRGTMIQQVYSGKRVGKPPIKMKRELSRTHKGVAGQPLSLRGGK